VPSNFKVDEQGLKRALRQAGKHVAQDAQREFDRLARQSKGRPVAAVKPTVKRMWERLGLGRLAEPQLTEYATELAAGRTINVTTR
jgi:hypothetical protein